VKTLVPNPDILYYSQSYTYDLRGEKCTQQAVHTETRETATLFHGTGRLLVNRTIKSGAGFA
jgi:hypothetical protein